MILPAQEIRKFKPITPFVERSVHGGMSYGLSSAGYDVRIAETLKFSPQMRFHLASTIEKFEMPINVVGMVHDKSSWARRALSLFNTVIEPSWRGFLTLELVYHGMEDLVIEAMQIYGMDVYYLPRQVRSGNEIDYIYGEDTLKEYKVAHPLEMYLENVTGMDGEGDFISKFGLEIRDELSLLVSRKRFRYATRNSRLIRPREGDLVYVPLMKNFFEITFVESENDQAMFYTLGRGRGGNVYVYAMKLKQFVFSNEIIETGIAEVDEQIRDNYFRTKITLTTGSGYYSNGEIVYQGTSLANANAQAIIESFDLVSASKYIQIIRVQGNFTTANVIGVTSGASWMANVVSDTATMDNAFEDIVDNNRIEGEADAILDWTETNPFGEA